MNTKSKFIDNLENRIQIISLLPEKVRASLARDSSVRWDFPWLEAIMASGYLNPDEVMDANDENFEEIYTAWNIKILRLCHFLPNVKFQLLEEDGLLGRLNPPLEVLSFEIDETKRSFYRRVLKETIKNVKTIENSKPKTNQTTQETLSHFLVGAVLLDMTEEVEHLVQLCPGIEHAEIDIEWLGNDFYEFKKNARNHNRGLEKDGDFSESDCINSVNVALRLSREACLNIFLKHNPKALDKLGSFGDGNCWTLNNFHDYFLYACSPSLMARAQAINMETVSKKSFEKDGNLYNLKPHCGPYHIAQDNRYPVGSLTKEPYFTAMVRFGVFDKNPEDALPMAVVYAHMELMQRLMPLVKDWEVVKELFAPVRSPITRAAEWKECDVLVAPGGYAQIEAVVVAFIDECLQRDQPLILRNELIRMNYMDEEYAVIQPFWSTAEWNCHAITLKLLHEGAVDLKETMQPLGADKELPLMEALNLYAPESAAVIHSHASRKKAHALIDEIDEG